VGFGIGLDGYDDFFKQTGFFINFYSTAVALWLSSSKAALKLNKIFYLYF